MDREQKINSWLRMSIVGSLTLGLAPFFPEPHIWGKVKWIMGGAVGMMPLDWFDTIFHGLPWLLLIALLGYKLALLLRK
ncbi:MAG: hypothetical protein HC819_06280 [Cyclobacteriaceae bacterium]|nr:hypothetical protein [Cyclobacteriaceae bacterium]